MKTALGFFLVLISSFVYSQSITNSDNEAKKAGTLPVIQGCDENLNKPDQLSCFNKRFSEHLYKELNNAVKIFQKRGVKNTRALVNFTIQKDGKLNSIQITESSDREFEIHLRAALRRVSKQIEKGKIKLIPAKYTNGEPLNFNFRLPVNLYIQ